MSQYKVKIEIVGGVPYILECPPEVDVEIKQVNHWQRWREQQKLIKDKLAAKNLEQGQIVRFTTGIYNPVKICYN